MYQAASPVNELTEPARTVPPAPAVPAVQQTGAFRATELDLPESTASILFLLTCLTVTLGIAVRTSLRDSRFLSLGWRVSLLIPRLLVLGLVLAILLNPRQRTQISRIERSRVGILIDTSLSMTFAAEDTPVAESVPETEASSATTNTPSASRADAVSDQLLDSGLLQKLSRTHEVSIFKFDSSLAGPAAVATENSIRFMEAASGEVTSTETDKINPEPAKLTPDTHQIIGDPASAGTEGPSRLSAPLNLELPETLARTRSMLQPGGGETRLGEALHQLIGQLQGRTLSGIVVISDGQSNAGIEVETARSRAERSGTRLICVGTGNQNPQKNLWVTGMQCPADVHKGDPFDITVSVQGTGIAGQAVLVELFQQSADSSGSDRSKIAELSVAMPSDGVPGTVTFQQKQAVPGTYEYLATVRMTQTGSDEMTLADNERQREVEVTDRRIRVLLISSGPMRDYQFVRNILYRHSGIESDVWLQTVTEEDSEFVSQEAKTLLTRFPATEAELFQYDVVVAFDPDWSRLSADEQKYLNRWVSDHSGGLIVVAGEIFTPRLAQDDDGFREIKVLYPVVLNRMLPDLQSGQRADQPWPLMLTPDGMSGEFLRIADSSGTVSLDLWKSFRGIYRSYPVRSLRDGAVSLIEYGNPRAETETGRPPFLASQFYGTGRTMFLGSAETWRLREISPQGHQQLWTSLVREAGQGRRSRGTARGMLLVDRAEAAPGQPVNIRAQLYDARLQPLKTDRVPISISTADGTQLEIPDHLNSDGRGTGQYLSNFRPVLPGRYRISLPVPDSTDVLSTTIEVIVPNLESLDATQNVRLLRSLTENTDGQFLQLTGISTSLPALLPDRSEPVIIEEQLHTLWDRAWMMYLMIFLLGLEWSIRRFVRLS